MTSAKLFPLILGMLISGCSGDSSSEAEDRDSSEIRGVTLSNPILIYPGLVDTHQVGRAGVGVTNRPVFYEGSPWQADPARDESGTLTFGPYLSQVAGGMNLAAFRLSVDDNRYNGVVARIDVYAYDASRVLASRDIRATDFDNANEPDDFSLRFRNDGYRQLEFRVYYQKSVKLTHHRTAIAPLHLENRFSAGIYTSGLSDADARAIKGLGMNFVLDYWNDPTGVATVAARARNIAAPFYTIATTRPEYYRRWNEARGDFDGPTVSQITNEMLESLYRDFAFNIFAYRDRVAAAYIMDEPDYTGYSAQQQRFAVKMANKYLPALPTIIVYGEDNTQSVKHLTYRGVEFYQRSNLNPDTIRSRLNRHSSSDPQATKILAIPRSYDDDNRCCNGKGGDWSDQELADWTRNTFNLYRENTSTVGVSWWWWPSNNAGGYPTRGLNELPLMQQAIADVLR